MAGVWVGGWIKWKYNQLSPQLDWVGVWADLGKNLLMMLSQNRDSRISVLTKPFFIKPWKIELRALLANPT